MNGNSICPSYGSITSAADVKSTNRGFISGSHAMQTLPDLGIYASWGSWLEGEIQRFLEDACHERKTSPQNAHQRGALGE